MVRSLLLALLLFATAAFGAGGNPDNPCGVSDVAQVVNYQDFSGTSKASCAPSPFGTGTVPSIRANKAGVVMWMYCPIAGGGWTMQWVAGTWARVSGINYLKDTASIAAATDPLAALNTMLASRVKLPMHDPSLTPIWCPFANEMFHGAPK